MASEKKCTTYFRELKNTNNYLYISVEVGDLLDGKKEKKLIFGIVNKKLIDENRQLYSGKFIHEILVDDLKRGEGIEVNSDVPFRELSYVNLKTEEKTKGSEEEITDFFFNVPLDIRWGKDSKKSKKGAMWTAGISVASTGLVLIAFNEMVQHGLELAGGKLLFYSSLAIFFLVGALALSYALCFIFGRSLNARSKNKKAEDFFKRGKLDLDLNPELLRASLADKLGIGQALLNKIDNDNDIIQVAKAYDNLYQALLDKKNFEFKKHNFRFFPYAVMATGAILSFYIAVQLLLRNISLHSHLIQITQLVLLASEVLLTVFNVVIFLTKKHWKNKEIEEKVTACEDTWTRVKQDALMNPDSSSNNERKEGGEDGEISTQLSLKDFRSNLDLMITNVKADLEEKKENVDEFKMFDYIKVDTMGKALVAIIEFGTIFVILLGGDLASWMIYLIGAIDLVLGIYVAIGEGYLFCHMRGGYKEKDNLISAPGKVNSIIDEVATEGSGEVELIRSDVFKNFVKEGLILSPATDKNVREKIISAYEPKHGEVRCCCSKWRKPDHSGKLGEFANRTSPQVVANTEPSESEGQTQEVNGAFAR